MCYNLVCALTVEIRDFEAAIDLLETFVDKMNQMLVTHLAIDPDVDCLRDNPRFIRMLADAKARLETTESPAMANPMPSAT